MQNYIRLKQISIEEVLPLIVFTKKTHRELISGENVKVNSLRLQTFASYGPKCSACGLEATHFAIERDHAQTTYHLNLYGIEDGEEVLFTHDHTLARALGGKDHISNTTTMCSPCNFRKSVFEREEVDRRRKEANNEQVQINRIA